MLMGAGYRPKGRYAPRAALSAFARYARPFFYISDTRALISLKTQASRLQMIPRGRNACFLLEKLAKTEKTKASPAPMRKIRALT